MFGINDDEDKQDKPVDKHDDDSSPGTGDDSSMPMPTPKAMGDSPLPSPGRVPSSGPLINPISGGETLGGAATSSLPSIIKDSKAPITDTQRKLLTPLPTPVSHPAPMPRPTPTPMSTPMPPATPMVPPEPVSSPHSAPSDADADELLDIKKEALQHLAPLVDKLDQPPDEKFKTVMMLLQASDNAELVKDAYDTANQILDEKARAQALLDVVNEINYFTQPHNPIDHPDSTTA